jgi:hypothetical protein
MSLLVYSTLSDYGRKVLGKSRSEQATLSDKSRSEQATLSDKSRSEQAIRSDKSRSEQAIRSDKSRSEQAALSVKSPLEETIRSKNKIRPTPTPPNSPNYEHIQNELTVKTIEEPYSVQINKDIDKPKPDRTSFKICTIM